MQTVHECSADRLDRSDKVQFMVNYYAIIRPNIIAKPPYIII